MDLRYIDDNLKRTNHHLQSEYCVLQSLAWKVATYFSPLHNYRSRQEVGDSKSDYPPLRWISIRISVQEEHPLGPVSGLHIPSLPDEQDCCGKNTDDPSEQNLHTSAEQGQRVETHCQGPEKQWVPITS